MTRQAAISSAQARVNPYWWMPFTPNRDFLSDPKLVTRAEGVYYTGVDGGRILDGSSGLFNVSAGHGRRPIADAVRDQLLELDFTPTFLRAQPRPFELAQRIAITAETAPMVYGTNITWDPACAIGMDIETGGHVFQLYVGNNTYLTDDRMYTQTKTGPHTALDLNTLAFGFNITRGWAM